MKKVLILLIFMNVLASAFAQNKYPAILDFSVPGGQEQDSTGIDIDYKFLMLSPGNAIDLREYGNKACEFKILGSTDEKIILEFEQPSKVVQKGMCASGTEKGILLLTFNKKTNKFDSENYLFESCLFSLETIETKHLENQIIEYLCENLQTSEFYILRIDLLNLQVTHEEKN